MSSYGWANKATWAMNLALTSDEAVYIMVKRDARRAARSLHADETFQTSFEHAMASVLRKRASFLMTFASDAMVDFRGPDGHNPMDVDWLEIAGNYTLEDYL
jgi:hypothetical protein